MEEPITELPVVSDNSDQQELDHAIPSQLRGIDREVLTPVVRRSLDSDSAQLGEWQYRQIDYAKVWQTSGGIFRFFGTARDGRRIRPWSVILKVALAPTPSPHLDFLSGDREPGSPEYWKREAELYRDGVLDWQGGSFVPPKCYGVVERDESTVWIWLEEVADCFGGDWPLEHYQTVARHLGQFNGRYLVGGAMPEHSSFCRSWTRAAQVRQRARGKAFPSREAWEDPAVCEWITPTDEARFRRLWDEQGEWLDVLDRLPQTFCHRDPFRNNLIARRTPDGSHQTVAIDWMQTGPGHLGEDFLKLVFITCLFMRVDCTSRELGELTFESYVAGLRDAGWNGDSRLARLGYAANAAIWAGSAGIVQDLRDPSFAAWVSELTGRSPGEIVASTVEKARYRLDLADEARELLPRLRRPLAHQVEGELQSESPFPRREGGEEVRSG